MPHPSGGHPKRGSFIVAGAGFEPATPGYEPASYRTAASRCSYSTAADCPTPVAAAFRSACRHAALRSGRRVQGSQSRQGAQVSRWEVRAATAAATGSGASVTASVCTGAVSGIRRSLAASGTACVPSGRSRLAGAQGLKSHPRRGRAGRPPGHRPSRCRSRGASGPPRARAGPCRGRSAADAGPADEEADALRRLQALADLLGDLRLHCRRLLGAHWDALRSVRG